MCFCFRKAVEALKRFVCSSCFGLKGLKSSDDDEIEEKEGLKQLGSKEIPCFC